MTAPSDKTLADTPADVPADATLGDATLAGDVGEGTHVDEPEGTVDGDRTLPGDSLVGRDRTVDEDRTVEEDPTVTEPNPRRRRPPIEHDTFNDATLADGVPPHSNGADDRTLAGDFELGADADRTLAGEGAAASVDDDRTLVGDAEVDPDRTVADDYANRAARDADATMVDDAPAGPQDDDRTVVGDEPEPRARRAASNDDRTIMGDEPDAGPAKGTTRPAAATAEQHYDLIEDFARGGMGKIWRALDLRIRREVAFKELLPNALKNAVVVERFLKEAQVTGQLEHPGVVPIYDLGRQANGTPYYSMKLVRGSTFKKSIETYHALPKDSSARRLGFVKLLQQFIAICNTMGYAHERGVLHRDLKPLNIMVGDFGETLVLDWGLARLMNDPDNSPMGDGPIEGMDDEDDATTAIDPRDAGTIDGAAGRPRSASDDQTIVGDDPPPAATPLPAEQTSSGSTSGAAKSGATQSEATQGGGTTGGTQAGATSSRRASVVTDYASAGSRTVMGSVMGTPAYMPAEQAVGNLNELDARSDIYSLGAILYEILTNTAPIAKDKLPAMLKAVVEGKITPPLRVDPTVPKALDAVCMKALSKDKANRYQSALDLAREVEAYLADEPVTAYREPWMQRLSRWVRRHRTLVTTASAVVALLILGGFGWSAIESNRIAGIQHGARERLNEARSAVEAQQFSKADELLRDAAGRVASEPRLADLKTEIQNEIEDVGRLVAAQKEATLARLRSEIGKTLTDADVALTQGNLDKSLQDLNAAKGKLTAYPELRDIAAQVQRRIDVISAQVTQRDARQEALTRFARFQSEVDQTRFYASFVLAGSVEEQRKTALQYGTQALAEYGLDKPDAELKRPDFLTDEQFQAIRENAFEVLLALANTEFTLGDLRAEDGAPGGGKEALAWLERAKKLGVPAKILPVLESLAYARLGDDEKRDERLKAAAEIEPTTALDFYLLGQEQRYNDNYDEAIRLYQQALRVDPNYFWALQNMGLCYLLQKRTEAAVSAYTAAIAERPREAICYLTRAIAYADLGRFETALADLKTAEDLKAPPYDLDLNRGGVYYKKAAYVFQADKKELDKLPPAERDAKVKQAEADAHAAIENYEAASKVFPDISAPHRNIGDMLRIEADWHLRQGDKEGATALDEQAMKELDTVIQRVPTDNVAYAIRADVEMRLGKDDAAIADFRRAARLEKDPVKRAASLKQIGIILYRQEKIAEAAAAYLRAIDANGKDAGTHRLLAEAYNKLGKGKEADEEWSKYLKLGEPVGDVYRGRALVRASQKQYRDAMNDYTRSLELEPSPNMLTRRGWAYLTQANQLALEDFSEAVKLNPGNPDSYTGRGYAKVMLGDYVGAVEDAELALEKTKILAAEGKNDWQNHYNASTIFAQAVDRASKDGSKTPEERETAAAGYTKRALQVLAEAARAAGQKNQLTLLRTIQSDTALDPIRQRPEFQAVFAPKKKPEKKPEKEPDESK